MITRLGIIFKTLRNEAMTGKKKFSEIQKNHIRLECWLVL